MEQEELFDAMYDSVVDGDVDRAVALAEQALRDGVAPLTAIDEGYGPGLTEVGERFGSGEMFLPDMMMAARAMQAALDRLVEERKAARGRRGGGRRRGAGGVSTLS